MTTTVEKLDEQKLKDILKEQREESQRYLGILKDDFDSKVALIAEQYASIKETLASHTETFASHTKMIVSMKEDIEIMKVDIAIIKQGLKRKVDVEEFEALERRVALLEAKSRTSSN